VRIYLVKSIKQAALDAMDDTLIKQQNLIVETQEQLLTTVDEQESLTTTTPYEVQDVRSLAPVESRTHEITDYLKRPLILLQGTLKTTDSTGSEVFRMELPDTLLLHPMIAPKIEGFRFIRGTIVVRFQHNAQPFQQGIYRLAWIPVLSPDDVFNTQLNTFKQFSGLNGIDINLMTKEPIEIEVPFVYPNPSYDMIMRPDSWATVIMKTYLPLNSLASSDVSYVVYGYFKDVEISMPTSEPNPYYEQLLSYGRNVNYIKTEMRGSDFIRKAKSQMGPEESATKTGGTISGIANSVTGIANVLSGIPLLGSIAAPIGTISSLVSGVASIFGWSKPRVDQVSTITRYKMAHCMNNCDGFELTTNLALFSNNAVNPVKQQFGVGNDELAIASVVRVPQYIDQFDVSTTTSVNTLLYSAYLNPAELSTTLNANSTLVTTNLGYVSSLFELWRGSLCFTFKASKTMYHTSRLMIVWLNSETPPPATYDSSLVYNYQVLWDLEQSYEQSIVIPYIQSVEWLNVHNVDSPYRSHNGYLAIYLLNDLRAASIAASNISIGVELFAGEDFSLQIPKNPELLGYQVEPVSVENAINGFMRARFISFNYVNVEYPWGWTQRLANPGQVVDISNDRSWAARVVSYYDIDTELYYVITPVSLSYTVTSGGQNANIVFVGHSQDMNINFSWNVPLGTTQILTTENIPITFKWTNVTQRAESHIGKLEALTTVPTKDITGTLVDSGMPHDDTVGENILSLRSLMKRYTYFTWLSTSSIPSGVGENFNSVAVFDPFGFVGDINFGVDSPGTDYISYIAPLYRFFKGELRFKVIVQDMETRELITAPISVFLLNNFNDATFPTLGHLNNSRLMFQQNLEGMLEFTVPYYNRNHSTIIGDVRDVSLLAPLSSRIMIAIANPPDRACRVTVYRSFGENCTFGYLLSAPTLNGVLKQPSA
jgi:hypothetical protein